VEFEYLKPQWAVAARWQYDYSTAEGTFHVVEGLPQDAWDYDPDGAAVRVIYPALIADGVRTQYSTGTWHDWQECRIRVL